MDDNCLNLRRFVRQSLNVLSQPRNDAEVTSTLTCLLHLASGKYHKQYCQQLAHFDIDQDNFLFAVVEFHKNHYVNVLEFLVDRFTVEWISLLPKRENGVKLLNQIFIKGPPDLVLIVLGQSISDPG